MKLSLYIVGSVPLSKVRWEVAEELVTSKLQKFVTKNLRLKKRFRADGAGTSLGKAPRRDVSGAITVSEKDLPNLLKRIPKSKFVMVDGVKVDTENIVLRLDGKGLEVEVKPKSYGWSA